MVARGVRDAEVSGSNPLSPTTKMYDASLVPTKHATGMFWVQIRYPRPCFCYTLIVDFSKNKQAGFSGIIVIIALLFLISSGLIGWRVYQTIQNRKKSVSPAANSTNIPSANSKVVYSTREECEKETNKVCGYQMCDLVPAGKTFEEVCGKNFKEGWVSKNFPLLVVGRTVTVSGVIDENVTKGAPVDLPAFLRISTEIGEVRIVYNPGEAECINSLDAPFDFATSQFVEAYGKVVSENTLSTCESKDFYIKLISRDDYLKRVNTP